MYKSQKTVAEVAIVELFYLRYHRKDNNYTYTFAGGCMQQC